MINIREVNLANDAAKIYTLNQIISPDETVETLISDLNNLRYGAAYVAENGDNIVGFISVAYPFWNQIGLIFHLSVSQEHRNNGIGTALTRHVVEVLRKENARFLSVRTAAWNNGALAFYNKLGFKPHAVFPDYFGDGNDMVWLHIDLRI
jgi:ribosomal protein S18 acetylase RimI-like enzyme